MKRLMIICFVLMALVIAFPVLAFENISPEEVKKKLDSGDEVFVLDVRQPSEYAEGYVPGAYLIPLGELEQRLGEIPGDLPVIVVCMSGGRSASASRTLDNNGFEKVYNMLGGTMAWKALPAQLYIKADDLRERMALAPFILDVRGASEYERAHIEGAVPIPVDELRDRADEIPGDKEIVIVAENDVQGDRAAEELIGFGYTNVKNLEGGMSDWQGATGVSAYRKRITTFAAVRME